MSTYSIKDLEQLTGVRAHTIRIWEQRYKVIEPIRSDTNIRSYTACDLKKMLNISLLNNNGLKISKIAHLDDDDLKQKVIETINQSLNHEDQVTFFIKSMIDMDRWQFEHVLSQCIEKFGIINSITQVIFPFLERVGILWQIEQINPAQEHFITNLIRQKIIASINALPKAKSPKPHFTLFLPEGELHEISLLMCDYILRSYQFETVFLGQSVPLIDLKQVHKIHPTPYFLTIATSQPEREHIKDYLNTLRSEFPETILLLSGQLFLKNDFELDEKMKLVDSFDNFHQYVKDLAQARDQFSNN